MPGEVIKEIIQGTESLLADGGARLGHRSTGGETADVGDLVRTIIVDSTVVARMRDEVMGSSRAAGNGGLDDRPYESTFNGGMGNGLTARHACSQSAGPTTLRLDPGTDALCRFFCLTDAVEGVSIGRWQNGVVCHPNLRSRGTIVFEKTTAPTSMAWCIVQAEPKPRCCP